MSLKQTSAILFPSENSRATEDILAGGNPREVAREFDLDFARGRARLHVQANQALDLTSSRGSVSAIPPVWRRTGSLDTFKAWIGTGGGVVSLASLPVPAQPWSGRTFSLPQDLCVQERADIEMAGYAYLFGDSSRVASYRQAIEQVAGAFELAVYMAHDVRIEAGGVLRIHGAPALVLFERLQIVEGGRLLINVPSRVHVGEISKLAAGGQ